MALRFASFRYIKTIWFGLENGRDESAPTPYGMFADIHLHTINGLCGVCWIYYYT